MQKTLLLFLLVIFSFNDIFSQNFDNKIVPIEILLKKNKTSHYLISPDGKYFAEIIKNNVDTDIVIIDIEKHELFKRIPLGERDVDRLYWLTSNRMIFVTDGEILAIDIDGTNPSLIAGRIYNKQSWNLYYYKNLRYNRVLNLLPEYKNEILIEIYNYQGYASVVRVNVFTGQKIVVKNGNKDRINKWITDRNGDIRLALRIDNKEIKFLVFNYDIKRWEQFYIDIDSVKYPLKIDGESYFKQNISFESFGYDSDIIYLTSNVNSDLRKLLKYNIRLNKVVEILVDDVNCDVNDPLFENLWLIFNDKKKELVGVRYQGISPSYKWFSKDFKNKHSIITNQFPNYVNDVMDVDNENKNFIIYQWSDIYKGNIGIFNFKDSTYSVIVDINKKLDAFELSKTKNIVIRTSDNYKLLGYLNLPLDYSKDSLVPLVIIPHGGPWARDYWELNNFSQYFATRGYATLRVNFRGSTGFGKEHILAGVNSIDKIMIDDIAKSAKYIIANYSIDRKNVFIFGHSYGGYATYMSLIKYPELYSAGVALSAPSNIKSWLKLQKKEKNYFAYEFWKTALGEKDSKYLSKISPINYVQKFDRPLLIFHGKNDQTIPVDQSIKMNKELKANNKDVKLEILENEGHTIFDSNSKGYILDAADEFFKNNFK
jgi:dipeptidyl aminopeptidase/acylaminoacyl peptidase